MTYPNFNQPYSPTGGAQWTGNPGYALPTNYGPPSPGGPYGFPPYYPPPTGSKKSRILLIVLAVVVALVGGGIGTFYLVRKALGPSDETQITAAISGLAEAVDTSDMPKILSYLCTEEAKQITADDDYDPDDTGSADPLIRLPVNVSNIQVNRDTATAELSRPPAETMTMRLKREDGVWKICDPGPVE